MAKYQINQIYTVSWVDKNRFFSSTRQIQQQVLIHPK
jgi:hypothetical protein